MNLAASDLPTLEKDSELSHTRMKNREITPKKGDSRDDICKFFQGVNRRLVVHNGKSNAIRQDRRSPSSMEIRASRISLDFGEDGSPQA
jgi:hypothetical protein